MRLAGPTVVYLLLFVKSVKQGRPHVAIHENILDFPCDVLTDTLGSDYLISMAAVNPSAHCGVPVERPRRYVVLTLKSSIRTLT